MDQKSLEERVREIFERQDFDLEKEENCFEAFKPDLNLVIKVFSSENYSEKDVKEIVDSGDKVFVDKGLRSVEDCVENSVSILEEDEKGSENFETPSYEVVGDIALINDLADVGRDDVIEGVLHHQPNVETILLKKEGLKGEYRVGDYEVLYGERTETVHKEFGCRFKLDPTKVYFSERFSTERKRVVDQIEDGEKVLVMFSGVGSFAIMAARLANPSKVVAVEKNPVAADYQEKNIKLNNVGNIVKGLEGDVKDVVPGLNDFDRVIMPLPGSSHNFLDLALNVVDNGFVHYYRFLENKRWHNILKEIEDVAGNLGKSYDVLDKVVCGERAAYIDRVCIDLEVE